MGFFMVVGSPPFPKIGENMVQDKAKILIHDLASIGGNDRIKISPLMHTQG